MTIPRAYYFKTHDRSTVQALTFLAWSVFASPVAGQWDLDLLPEVPVSVEHPPELGFTVHRIAFADSTGSCSNEFVDALIADFSRSQIEIVERERIQQVLEEINFSSSGLIRSEDMKPLGELLGPTAMVWVDVGRCDAEKTRSHKTYRTDKGTYRTYYATTKFHFKAALRIVDVASGKIESAKEVSETFKDSASSNDGYPEYPSAYKLQDAAMQTAVYKVHRMILPWQETLSMRFFTGEKCNLKAAYQMVRINDYTSAEAILLQSLETCPSQKKIKPRHIARAHYNLGVTRMLMKNYDEAMPSFRQAFQIRPSGNQIQEGINHCQHAIATTQRMKEFIASSRNKEMTTPETHSASQPEKSTSSTPTNSPSPSSLTERLEALKQALDEGLITQQDYEEDKNRILNEL